MVLPPHDAIGVCVEHIISATGSELCVFRRFQSPPLTQEKRNNSLDFLYAVSVCLFVRYVYGANCKVLRRICVPFSAQCAFRERDISLNAHRMVVYDGIGIRRERWSSNDLPFGCGRPVKRIGNTPQKMGTFYNTNLKCYRR